jgi:hypothetical protein
VEQATWKNRIIGYASVNPKVLLPHDLNWRTHSTEQEQALEAVLAEIGLVQNIIVNATTTTFETVDMEEEGEDIINLFRTEEDTQYVEHVRIITPHLVDGHLRASMAVKYNQPEIPVTFVNLSPEEEDTILATYDPLGAMAKVDAGRLRTLFERFKVQNEQLQSMLAELADQAGLYSSEFTPLTSDADYAKNPYEDKQYLTRKQVTILFDMTEYASFNAAVKELGAHYGLDAMTQVVLQTMIDAAKTIPDPHVLARRIKTVSSEEETKQKVERKVQVTQLPTLTAPPAKETRPTADEILPVDESTSIPELI